jgi:hypothetical protein
MTPCRDCHHTVSDFAWACPRCGAPYPARPRWDGWGYEYKSPVVIAGLPLIHVAFKYRQNRVPVVAKGIIAIGQFGCGVVTVAQFGVGVFAVCQVAIGGYVLAQFAAAYSLVAQLGLYLHEGHGQLVKSPADLVGSSAR